MNDDQLFEQLNDKITSILNSLPIAYMKVELHLESEIRDNKGHIFRQLIILPGSSKRMVLSDLTIQVPLAEWDIFTRIAVFQPERIERIRSAIVSGNEYTRNKIQEFLSH